MTDGPRPLPALRLEPLIPSHAEKLWGGLHDPELYTFIADIPPASVETLRARYEGLATQSSPDGRQAWLNWAIWSVAHHTYVGYVQATVEARRALLAYVLFRPYWGCGYGRAAVAEMMRLLRVDYGVNWVGARVDTRNIRSRLLLESLGFECTAIHPNAEEIHGQWSDEAEYRLEDVSREHE